MDEQTKAAFASASDTSKQLITLATGLLALEITFAKELLDGNLDSTAKFLAGLSWALLLLSVIVGVWTLLALTGSLSSGTTPTPRTIFGSNVRIPAMLQILLFLGGLLLTVVFGIQGVW